MNHLPLKIWLIVSVSILLSAGMIRLVRDITRTTEAGSPVVIILFILIALGVYAFLIYLAIKPSLKTLKSLPVRIWITVMVTAGLIGGIIHFVHFIPSPEAGTIFSIIIASLLLVGGVSACLLIIWVIWSVWKPKKADG